MAKGIQQARGFTLVEMVSVIVLLGILSAGATLFIGDSVRIYNDSTRRSELTQQGRFAVERVSREIRNALPGSVRVGTTGVGSSSVQCLEFYPIVDAASYLNNVTGVKPPSNNFEAVDLIFDETISSHRVAIHTIEEKDVYVPGSRAMADLASVGPVGNPRTITLSNNLNFKNESLQKRFFIVSDRVSFCASDGQLMRYQGYASAGQPQDKPPSSGGVLLASNIRVVDTSNVTVFEYSAGTLNRSAVVHLDFRFSDSDADGEWVRFSHEVFVRNVP